MDFSKARSELRRMKRRDLFALASNQKISRCLIGGRACGFYLRYKGLHFCVSEVLGESCLFERLEKMDEQCQKSLGTSPLLSGKMTAEFKVYYRDDVTRSMIFLGRVIERRIKERGNNLRDLLNKARKDCSDRVSDPSKVFLLGP